MLAAVASLPVGAAFLSRVAAPAFLDAPGHACAYCLLAASPLALVAAAAWLAGAFSTGWSTVARRLARHDETAATLPAQRRVLLRFASLGYLTALLLTSGRLLLR